MKKRKTILFSDYKISPPPSQLKQAHIDSAMRSFGKIQRNDSFFGQLKAQISYMGLWFWTGILIICGILSYIMTQEIIWVNGVYNPALNSLMIYSISGPIIASVSAPVLSRSFSHNMWELENASFHNLPRLTAIRLIICASVAVLTMMPLALLGFGFTGAVMGMTALLAPFLLANGINYMILGRLRGNSAVMCCIGANSAIGLLFSIPARKPYLFHNISRNGKLEFIAVLTLLFCAGTFILGVRNIMKRGVEK